MAPLCRAASICVLLLQAFRNPAVCQAYSFQ